MESPRTPYYQCAKENPLQTYPVGAFGAGPLKMEMRAGACDFLSKSDKIIRQMGWGD